MANNITPLSSNTKLQFIIVPWNKTYDTSDNNFDWTGKLIFWEETHTIEVNGTKYKSVSANEYTGLTAALTTLQTNGLLTKTTSDGVDTYTSVNKIGNLTVSGLNSGSAMASVTDAITTVKSYIDADFIKTINSKTPSDGAVTLYGTDIDLSSSDSTKVSALPKTVNSQAPSNGNITLTGEHITVGGSTGTYKDQTLKFSIEDLYSKYGSIDKDSFVQEGKLVWGPESVGEGASATPTQGTYTAAQYTEKFGNDTIKNIETAGLKPFIQLIIKSESSAESYILIAADKLVDIYSVPASQSGPVTLAINGHEISASFALAEKTATGSVTSGTPTAGASSKEDYVYVSSSVEVKTLNGEVKTNGVTVTSVGVDKAGAAKKAYDDALGSSSDAAGTATIHGALKEAAKHTTVTGSGTGTASTNDYIVVTDSAASGDAHSYTVKTTQALDTAITTAASNAAAGVIEWNVIS